MKVDKGELWSFLRSVLSQGADINQDWHGQRFVATRSSQPGWMLLRANAPMPS